MGLVVSLDKDSEENNNQAIGGVTDALKEEESDSEPLDAEAEPALDDIKDKSDLDELEEIDVEDEESIALTNFELPEDGEDTTEKEQLIDEYHLKGLCKAIKQRGKQKLDTVVCCSGDEGVGKSMLMLKMGKYISKDFSCERNVLAFPTYDSVRKKAKELPKYSPVILDEAMRTMYKRLHGSRSNIMLNQFFSMCRKYYFSWFLGLPRFSDLDAQFREHRVLLNIILPSQQDTGVGVVHRRDDNPYLPTERWHLKESYMITTKKQSRFGSTLRFDQMTQNERIGLMQGTPNYFMTITFGLDRELEREYEVFLKKHKSEMENDEGLQLSTSTEKLLQLRVVKSVALLVGKYGVARKEVAKALQMDISTINSYLRKIGGVSKDQQKAALMSRQLASGDWFGAPDARKVDALPDSKKAEFSEELLKANIPEASEQKKRYWDAELSAEQSKNFDQAKEVFAEKKDGE